MVERLKTKETLALYGVIIASSLMFFLLGVFVGKEYFSEVQPPLATLTTDTAPVEDVKPQLDFYEDLMEPSKSAGTGKPTPESKAPESKVPESKTTETKPPDNKVAEKESPAEKKAVKKPEPAERPSAGSFVYYTIQVGALKTEKDAQQMLEKVQDQGYTGQVVLPQRGQSDLYRVWVGTVPTLDEATQLEGRLKSAGFSTYLKKVNP